MKNGLKCYMTSAVSLYHSVGNGEKKFGPLKMRVGAPIRSIIKLETVCIYSKKKYTPLKFKVRFLALITIRSFFHITVFEDRTLRKKYIKRRVHRFQKEFPW